MRQVRTVGLAGTGVIGAGWAVRVLARGLNVVAWDPAAGTEVILQAAIARAWPSARKLGIFPGADPSRVRFVQDVSVVAEQADFIQESAPEDEDLKRSLLSRICETSPPDVVVATSTSGLLPTRLQEDCRHPERIVVGHPFNPVYLLPLVEVVGGQQTTQKTIDSTVAFYRDLGMHPLLVRNEIDGFLADRLLEALWREILHLVNDGIATTDELDQAIVYGPGLRWAGMGTNLIYHLAGGEQGMRHMLHQFGPALQLPWTKLVAPPLTKGLIERLVEGTQRQAGGRTIEQLERLRDDYLISVMRGLAPHGIGAGRVLADREAAILEAGAVTRYEMGKPVPAPLELYRCRVHPDWVDYNGHMTESAYLLAFGWNSDALFRYVGIDEDYRRAGYSIYTVQSAIHNVKEAKVEEPLRFTTQVLGSTEKKLHIFQAMFNAETDELLSTVEQMLLHVDMSAEKVVPFLEAQGEAIRAVTEAHRSMPLPPEVGSKISL